MPIHNNQLVLFAAPEGKFTAMEALGVGKFGAGEKTFPGSNVTAVYVTDHSQRPIVYTTVREAPSDLPSTQVMFYEEGTINFFVQRHEQEQEFDFQVRANLCTRLDNPGGWQWLIHYATSRITGRSGLAGPDLTFNGQPLQANGDTKSKYTVVLIRPALSGISLGDDLPVNGVFLLKDIAICQGSGYPGADKIIFVTQDADDGVTANVKVSRDGGGLFTSLSTDPFDVDEHLGPPVARLTTDTAIRLIIPRKTQVADEKPKFKWVDLTTTDVVTATWTETEISGGAVNTAIGPVAWPEPDLLLFGVGGDIYRSSDYGEADLTTPVYDGTPTINAIVKGRNKKVWAVGNTGTILVAKNGEAAFEAKQGPTGTPNIYAIAEAEDGTVWIGAGTAIYRSEDGAGTTAGWTQVKDFGTNQRVVGISLAGGKNGGNSQLIRAAVHNTTPGDGRVWISVDGKVFERLANVTNGGFTASDFSEADDNLGYVATLTGKLLKFSPQS